MRQLGMYAIAAGVILLTAGSGLAQPGDKNEEAALFKKAEAFVAAFNKGDAKAVAGFWTPDGIYRDQTGNELKGRPAIEKMFQAFFAANKGLQLRINVTALRFSTKDVAIEEGTTEVLHADGSPPSVARYVILHVKKDGDWYLDIVKDSVYTAPTNYKHLSDLEWIVGNWAEDVDKGQVSRLSFSWGPNQNFLVGTFAITIKNITLSDGSQRIGWDAATKKIRSWTFDDSGSFGEGTWSHEGDKWVIKTHTTLRDGKKVSATNIVQVLNADTFTWQSTNQMVDGKALPDTMAVKMKRVK